MLKFNSLFFYKNKIYFLVLSLLLLNGIGLTKSYAEQTLPTCTYISSYSPDNPWQDRFFKSLTSALKNRCHLEVFYMDTKQISDENTLKNIGVKAKKFIEKTQPDIMIFSDDNAVKYVLVPYFKNIATPAVFAGVNETSKPFNLPHQSNITGMLERINFTNIFNILFTLKPGHSHIAYLSSYGTSEEKALLSFHKTVKKHRIQSSSHRTFTEEEWRARFLELNNNPSVDFILLGRINAFPSWDKAKNLAFVKQHTKKLVVSLNHSLLPFSTLGVTRSATEQGAWAGSVAIEILNGTAPNKIPIVPNRIFQYWYHPELIKKHPYLSLTEKFKPVQNLSLQKP